MLESLSVTVPSDAVNGQSELKTAYPYSYRSCI